ncbi:hypothetical protein BH10BAC2_BH10BAC2_37040 [soil metagenome]
MKNTFTISFNNKAIKVETMGENNGHTEYMVYLPDGDLHLRHTEDDEGAGRWIDTQTDHETEISAEVGQLIELHNVQRND